MWRWLSFRKPPAADPGTAAPPGGGLANYRIERLLGKGAASQVFLAQDRSSGRLGGAEGAGARQRAGAIRNGTTPSSAFAARPRCCMAWTIRASWPCSTPAPANAAPGWPWRPSAGCDLTRYTRPARLLPPPLVARVGARLAEALAYAHRRGVVHRDVKPANVLVDWTKDTVKLSDFGLARSAEHTQTRSGIALGSPDYMAPEQLAGGAVGPASDVYGLGATLFELLAGRRPHQADNLGDLLRAVASEPAPPLARLRPELDPALCDAVMALLAKDLSQRPSDAAQVAVRLWSVANGTTGGLRHPLIRHRRMRRGPLVPRHNRQAERN